MRREGRTEEGRRRKERSNDGARKKRMKECKERSKK